MFKVFNSDNADDAWQQIATAFRDDPHLPIQNSRAGVTREILHAAISIRNPVERWVVSRTPPINPAFALAEVVWLITGRNDAQFLNYFNSKLPGFAGTGANYHGAYGHRLRRELGIDQLERAFQTLQRNPDSRQVVLQIWKGDIDLPSTAGAAVNPDIPCNIISLLKVREGTLEWTQILRSNDLFRGLPYNFVQFTTLQEVIAGWLGLRVGSYNQLSDSLHLYSESDKDILESVPVREIARNTDSLRLPRSESEKVFRELAIRIEDIINPAITVQELRTMARQTTLPQAFKNILCLLCAEGARRRRSLPVAEEAIAECSNTLLQLLFQRWQSSRVTSLQKA